MFLYDPLTWRRNWLGSWVVLTEWLFLHIIIVLADEYPEVFRFTASVFPSKEDDVVTSPYNSLFSLHKLAEHADCVFPIDN